jgi:hypothetical protein
MRGGRKGNKAQFPLTPTLAPGPFNDPDNISAFHAPLSAVRLPLSRYREISSPPPGVGGRR